MENQIVRINLAVQNKRNIACTSRGGYCLLRDAKINNRHSNIIVDNFDIILKLFNMMPLGVTKRFGFVTSWRTIMGIVRIG